jgi:hypothetical protein
MQVGTKSGKVKVVNVSTGLCEQTHKLGGPVSCLEFENLGRGLFAGDEKVRAPEYARLRTATHRARRAGQRALPRGRRADALHAHQARQGCVEGRDVRALPALGGASRAWHQRATHAQ